MDFWCIGKCFGAQITYHAVLMMMKRNKIALIKSPVLQGLK